MNDVAPFEVIVAEHGDRVLRVCRAVAGQDDADDVWSETFLSAMRAYPALPPDANHGAWLVTIAHRKAIDAIRRRQRRAVPVAELPEGQQHPPLADPGTDHDLGDALARLPDKQRLSVAYHYLAGLSYAEVASILGGSTDAARRAAADGIHALRKSHPGTAQRGSP